MQKYRADVKSLQPDGASLWFARWMGRVDDLEANSPEIYEAVEPKWDPFEIEESDNG
jgi:hypothetical protein